MDCYEDHDYQYKRFSALDPNCCHPMERKANVDQEARQIENTVQKSNELIIVKDSCDVTVETTDTQAAVNIQAALQFAIALVIDISVASSDRSSRITQELLQKINVKQANNQKTVIENSRGVKVTTTDTDVSVNVQLLAQILAALVARINIA
ncbi:spore coat protein [Aneurinibacillus sp. BA2021]|nr:spore coat protein [Aneurinibacillus sp. BA2021]